MIKQEQPEPFLWKRVETWEGGVMSHPVPGLLLSDGEESLARFRGVVVPVSRLAEFEAFVKQIREEVEGGN